MKVHFVFPKWEKLLESHPQLEQEVSGYEIGSFKMSSLGIPTAAAALPDGVEVSFQDQNLGHVDASIEADLVGIGFFTPQAGHAYRLSRRFRDRGIPTIAGGIHPTMVPEETLEHFDAVAVGEVEGLWERILRDVERGTLKGIYRLEAPPPSLNPKQPMRSLFKSSTYLKTGVVQIARGCTFPCGYCVVPVCYGSRIRFRPVEDVLEDIRTLPYRNFYIADENILFQDRRNREYASRLRLTKAFYLAAYPHILRTADEAFLTLLSRAGCMQIYLVFGQDGPLTKELADDAVIDAIWRAEASGIEIMASITLGNDGDGPGIGDRILEYCEKAKLNLVEFTIMTPWPGTRQFRALEEEGRILTRDWDRFNSANVVFRPRHFSPEALRDLYLDMWKRFYRDVDAFEIKKRYVKAFSGNILYRRSQRSGVSATDPCAKKIDGDRSHG